MKISIPVSDLKKYGYIRNKYAKYRRMPRKNMKPGVRVDCIHESRQEWLDCDPVIAFIGHAVISHWRYTPASYYEEKRLGQMG